MGFSKIINHWDFKKENNEDCGKEENEKINEQNNKEDSNKEYKKDNDDGKDKDKENKVELKCPIISMLTLNQVKEHFLNLLPKFFFKVDKNYYSFNALSDGGNRITLFNEYKILYSAFIKSVLPLMIEFTRESFSNLEIQYFNKSCAFPFMNPINDKNKLCINDYCLEPSYIIEHFFDDNYNEFNFLKYRNIDLFPLIDSKYWTDINFNKMKEFNKKIMQKTSMSCGDLKEALIFLNKKDKRNYDDDKNILCYFRKYNS